MNRILASVLILLLFSFPAISQNAEILHLKVESGDFVRINTLVSFALDGVSISDTTSFQLFEDVNGKLTEKIFQIENGYIPLLWWVLDGITSAGSSRKYLLINRNKLPQVTNITAVETPDAIVLKNHNSEILHYRTAVLYPPPGADSVYKRSGFIHPLMTPSGNILTRVNPPDHYHHMGIWNPWTKVKIGNHITDFWNLAEKQGTVRFSGLNSKISGPLFGGFSIRQEHVDFQGEKPAETVLNEVWDVRAWNVEPVPGIRAWLVDLTTFLSVAGDSSIVFEAYRYGGGIGFRATEEWTKDNSSIITSEGKTRKEADGTRARWAGINGKFEKNGQSGIAFFSHPSNREHPEPMRVWPENANNNRGDVYFEFCPIRDKEWTLLAGNIYRLKYRMVIYDGKIDNAAVERIWTDFAYPPAVSLYNPSDKGVEKKLTKQTLK
jgi:hypothetical protein